MSLFAISDLHLPGSACKPMDIFGEHWQGHFEKIRASWLDSVREEDVVLLPGDFSWAMTLDEAGADICAVGALPGKKVILRGNHDYWWSAIGKVRAALPPGMYAVQNDAIAFPGFVVCGTRGWLLPDADTSPEDEKVFRREVMRLEMTLKAGRAMAGDGRLICMMHYPPLTQTSRETPFMDVLRAYMPDDVVYGHLHGGALSGAVRGTVEGMRFHQVSCDGLGFRMYRLPD